MTEVEYAIPSRARAETLVAKTLPLLLRLGVPSERISIFVHPEEQAEYVSVLAEAAETETIPADLRIADGARGMRAQRHAIHDHYPDGAKLIQIDDDLDDLLIRADEKRAPSISSWEWEVLVAEAFTHCSALGARLWGLYPVPNPYFMRPRVRTDLSYIGGGLWGCINARGESPFRVTLEDKEDFERSLACYAADGVVVRFDYVTWKTRGYFGKGGMQHDGLRTPGRILASAEELARRYPDLATLNLTKKSGKAELRLRDRRRATLRS